MKKHVLKDILKVNSLVLLEKNLRFSPKLDDKVGFEVKFLSSEDCAKLAEENNWQDDFQVDINEILEESNICVVAEVNGRLAHWTHISFGDAYVAEIDRRIRVGSESAYLHGVYTGKNFRRMGIASAVIEKLSAYLREKAVKQLYILVDSSNASMLRVVANAGFKRIGAITLIRIGEMKIYKKKGTISDFLESK